MAKDDSTTTKAAPAKATPKAADPAPAKDTPKADTSPTPVAAAAEGERVSTCVVNGGRGMHVGNAVNGAVCSYHAMHYDSHGNRR